MDRPPRQTRLPSYLEDFDVGLTGSNLMAQQTQGQEEGGIGMITTHTSSHSSSPSGSSSEGSGRSSPSEPSELHLYYKELRDMQKIYGDEFLRKLREDLKNRGNPSPDTTAAKGIGVSCTTPCCLHVDIQKEPGENAAEVTVLPHLFDSPASTCFQPTGGILQPTLVSNTQYTTTPPVPSPRSINRIPAKPTPVPAPRTKRTEPKHQHSPSNRGDHTTGVQEGQPKPRCDPDISQGQHQSSRRMMDYLDRVMEELQLFKETQELHPQIEPPSQSYQCVYAPPPSQHEPANLSGIPGGNKQQTKTQGLSLHSTPHYSALPASCISDHQEAPRLQAIHTPQKASGHYVQAPCSLQAGPSTHLPPNPYHKEQLGMTYQPHSASAPATILETSYRGPSPSIPYFVNKDPCEFSRLKLALENLLPVNGTELFKYQILVDHLKLREACLIADAYLNSPTPYTDTMTALNEKFGQPHQLALNKIAAVMNAPDIRRGDFEAFERFALQVRALVGMLKTLGVDGDAELRCGSHVARLLSKLPPELRSSFRRHMYHKPGAVYTLIDFSDWLQYESWCQEEEGVKNTGLRDGLNHRPDRRKEQRMAPRSTTILHGVEEPPSVPAKHPTTQTQTPGKKGNKYKQYCPFCDTEEHFLSKCPYFLTFTTDQKTKWIQENKKCWRCGRAHQASQCTLKKACVICQRKHLNILHDVNFRPQNQGTCLVSSLPGTLYINRPGNSRVLLKVVRVRLHHGNRSLDTYAVLDDGSERTILLAAAASKLGLQGTPEELALRTIRQDVQNLQGSTVSFQVSSAAWPSKSFQINEAFTAMTLGLADHSYPMAALKKRYKHLQHLPIQSFENASPLLLIGADHPHLVTPIAPVRLGPPGGPTAIKTRLGWVLQGPTRLVEQLLPPQQCLLTSVDPLSAQLRQDVERLWQIDIMPYRHEKLVTRSREDQAAIHMLETKTVRVEVNGVQRYATPLLLRKNIPLFEAKKEAVMPLLRNTERRLAQDQKKAAIYNAEVQKLVDAGYVVKLSNEEAMQEGQSWYIPHHLVEHNGKPRIVFNCSFQYKGLNLNESLLPGPVLGPSLLGVLLRFREHAFAISGDIKGMFHQVRLLPEDRSLLRFVWRGADTAAAPEVYEWQVLPFGATCSPCCATYALQRHVVDHSQPEEDVRFSVERCFYVDNCLQSVTTKEEAKHLVTKLRDLLATGGFEIRQWASNDTSVVKSLPAKARSDSSELWLLQDHADPQESTLGLRWQCSDDTLGFKHRPIDHGTPTLRNVYRVLASQYDPLGFILPFTTRAKVLVQQLWAKQREWDDPLLPEDLLHDWISWQSELTGLHQINMPRCYVTADMDLTGVARDLHVFCDASEKAYGSVAYLRSEDNRANIEVTFVMARSRVAPKRQQSVPRLELCAAVTGAQLAKLIRNEITLPIRQTIYWTDSTTVLNWLQSESCRFKVFVGTRVAEIQELTDLQAWRYVDSACNPADDLTRGKSLSDLAQPNRWSQGPAFLQRPPSEWPIKPTSCASEDTAELKRSVICCITTVGINTAVPDTALFSTWSELLDATAQGLHGAAGSDGKPSATCYREAEMILLRKAQQDSFGDDYRLLKAGKPVSMSSRLLTLAPEFDRATELIRVGGRLRRAEGLEESAIHPVVLHPSHSITKLLIQDYDTKLCHPGPERVFGDLRRTFWILRAREAIRKHQHQCFECRRWKSKPAVPKMADLPPARLRLSRPPFYSTGMDCFGPFQIKIGRRNEKRWGIIFKCLTTRSVHLDVLANINVDSFLMALRRFIARRGTPAELYSDQGTNFKAGEKELRQAFANLSQDLKDQLAKHQISFNFNPPAAPHFGGAWEREIRSAKSALQRVVGTQTVTEEVLRTVLIEIEGILNAKPLGYVSSNLADPDPVTPNLLLMGRRDSALPQVTYHSSEQLGKRHWRYSQVLADHFWSRFVRDYLPSLQTRSKWQRTTAPLSVGQVVMILDPQLPRAFWPIGQVVRVFPGKDNQVRSAEIRVKDRLYTRPVARLVTLPEIPDTDED